MGSPAASRGIAASLARLTSGRVCSIDYRLAPQNPFPAGIYDVLLSYLSLLYPASDSFHAPIAASSIVLAGDSTGGTICLALLQLLLQFQRNSITQVTFNNKSATLSLPAGIAVLSAYCDHTDSLPSYVDTRNIDYSGWPPIYNEPNHPSCSIWPASPPRAVAYCERIALSHPLVSQAAADDWTGSPPIWFACGEESVLDSCKVVASQAARQGVIVVWEQYMEMPHIFPILPGLSQLTQVKRCLEEWGRFCRVCVEHPKQMSESRAVCVRIDNVIGHVNFRDLLIMDQDEVRARMKKGTTSIEESSLRHQKIQTKL